MGSGTKSYMSNGFLIYEEMHKYLVIDEEPLGIYTVKKITEFLYFFLPNLSETGKPLC
jgi:hypothetical protein